MMFYLLAQTAPAIDPFSGGGGWVGAGLLGLVLSWLLLKHLPDKDRQINTFVADSRAEIRNLVERHEGYAAALAKDFKESLAQILKHCEEEIAILRGSKL